MIELTLKKVVTAARKAYDEHRLTAQAKSARDRQCRYKIYQYRCAIGACMSDDELKYLIKTSASGGRLRDKLNEKALPFLIANDEVKILDNERTVIEQLQAAHDEWCSYARGIHGDNPVGTANAERYFVNLITQCEARL